MPDERPRQIIGIVGDTRGNRLQKQTQHPASVALTRLISSGLYGITATDPVTYSGISALLIVVAVIACMVPTIRAIRVDPSIALRYE